MQPPPTDGRAARRVLAMRRAQAAALDLIEAHGFDAVTIESVAARAGVAPATIYRNFGTKERLVLWDEYDPMLFEAIRERLPTASLRAATLEGAVAALGAIYTEDAARIRRRAKIITTHPALMAATSADRAALTGGLAALFLEARACRDALAAEVVAGALVVALEAGVRAWVGEGDDVPLARTLRRAFRRLDALADEPQ